jgi:hypothetical protein
MIRQPDSHLENSNSFESEVDGSSTVQNQGRRQAGRRLSGNRIADHVERDHMQPSSSSVHADPFSDRNLGE